MNIMKFLAFCAPLMIGTAVFAQANPPAVTFNVSPDLPLKHRLVLSSASFENNDMTCSLIVKAYYKQESETEKFSLLIRNIKVNVLRADEETPDQFIGENELINLGVPGTGYVGGEVSNFSCKPAVDPTPQLLPECKPGMDKSTCGATFQRLPATYGDLPGNVEISPTTFVRTFYTNNTLYIAADGGLYISYDKGRSLIFVRNLYYNLLRDVVVQGGTIYVASYSGIHISTDMGESFTQRTTEHGLGENSVYRIFVDGMNVYAATGSGLSISNDGGKTFVNRTKADGLVDNTVNTVYAAGNKVFAGTAFGLSISLDGGKTFKKSPDSNFAGTGVQAMAGDGKRLYIGGFLGTGVSTDDGQTFTEVKNARSWTKDITIDGQTVYIATLDGLAVAKDGVQATNWPTIGNNRLRSITAVGQTLFVGTEAIGLAVSENGGAEFKVKNPVPGDLEVRSISATPDKVYVGTSKGLSVSVNQGASFTSFSKAHGLASPKVNAVLASGKKIYVATDDGLSISEDNGGSFKTLTKDHGLSHSTIGAVFEKDQNLYVGTFDGLNISHDAGQTFTFKSFSPQPWKSYVTSVAATDEDVYAATSSGLAVSHNGGASFVLKNTATGLPGDEIRKVTVDQGQVYILCNRILFVSKDRGETFKTILKNVNDVVVSGSRILAVTDQGLGVSSDSGKSFVITAFSNAKKVGASGNQIYLLTEKYVYSVKL